MTHDDIWQVRFRQATRRVQELEEEVAWLKASAPTLGQAVEQTADRERWKRALSFAKGIISRLDTTEVMRSSVSGIAYDAAERAVFIRNLATEALAAPVVVQPQAAEPKGLTDDEIIEIASHYVESDGWMDGDGILSFARALLAKGE